MTKYIALFLGTFGLVFALGTTPVSAQIDTRVGLEDAAGSGGAGFNTTRTLPQVIGGIISAILAILAVLFLCLTIYAGFLWMTAAGDDKKIQKAKDIIRAAIIGLVIILGAYSITDFVFNALQRAQTPAIDGY